MAVATALTRKVIPPSGKVYLEGKELKKMEDLREAWETWLSGRQRGNFFKPWTSSGMGDRERSYRNGQSSSGYVNRSGYGGVVTCFVCGEKGHISVECRKNVNAKQGGGGAGVRPITCFSCGKAGHRSVECPNTKVGVPVKKEGRVGKVSKIVVGGKKGNVACGLVNGVECKILVDSGAEVGVVPKSLVGADSIECGIVHISDVHGKTSVHQSTIVNFELGGRKFANLAVIDEREGEDVISIIPFDVMNEEEVTAFRQAIEENKGVSRERESENAEVNVLTRSQVRAEEELDRCESDVVVEDLWCVVDEEESVQKELGDDALEPSDVREEAEPTQECLRESVDEDEEVSGVPVELNKVIESESECEMELHELANQIGPVRSGSDSVDFREAVKSDDSLKEWREWGEKKERGFAWKNGVLVRSQYVTWEEFRDVLVVPKEYRQQIMELGHERNGHLGGEKVAAMVGRYFLWPGMSKELVDHGKSCKVCQLKSK